MRTEYCEIDEDMSQRLHIMKFIFIVLVVFIHSDELPELPYSLNVPQYVEICKEFVVNGVCAVAVPGFFFLSGFLLFSKEFTWVDNIKRKARSMLLPYLAINSFWILFFRVMQSFEITADYFSGEAYQIDGLRDILEAYFNPIPLYYPFWFLRDLMILNLFAKMIKRMIDRYPLLLAAAIIALQLQVISLPFLVSNNSFCMFSIAGYLTKYRLDLKKLVQKRIWYSGLLFVSLIFGKLYLGEWRLLALLYPVCGLYFFYQVAGRIRKSRGAGFILWCAQFTFFIYAFHEYYEAMIKKILMLVIPQYGMVQLLEFFVLPIGITAGCIMAGNVFKKKIPFVYGVICGRR